MLLCLVSALLCLLMRFLLRVHVRWVRVLLQLGVMPVRVAHVHVAQLLLNLLLGSLELGYGALGGSYGRCHRVESGLHCLLPRTERAHSLHRQRSRGTTTAVVVNVRRGDGRCDRQSETDLLNLVVFHVVTMQ